MSVHIDHLVKLQKEREKIRNVSIIAHVDHGKTTLTDTLISTNGIFSRRNAGKIRYMDFTPEEQLRGITMKSAAISLLLQLRNSTLEDTGKDLNDASNKREEKIKPSNRAEHDIDSYLINLIDSPGHVDFTSEVGSALRVTDGCVAVVDAVEGVCIQTRVVLRQAWLEGVKPVLFVNKLDRLVLKLEMDPVEAYLHLRKIVESANEIYSSLVGEEYFSRIAELNKDVDVDVDTSIENNLEDEDDGEYFSPVKGNVVFGSALGGWGFSIPTFAAVYSKKLGCNYNSLCRTLWGSYYYSPKTKSITKKNISLNSKSQPMFVNFILKPLWGVFESCIGDKKDAKRLQQIVKSMNLTITPRELKDSDDRTVCFSVLSNWLPLASAILRMVVRCLPSPLDAQRVRIPLILNEEESTLRDNIDNDVHEESPEMKLRKNVYQSLLNCDKDDDNTVAFVSKACVFAVPNSIFARSTSIVSKSGEKGENEDTNNAKDDVNAVDHKDKDGFSFIGLGRLFSGTLRVGDSIHVLGPRYHPRNPEKYRTLLEVKELYILMGRSVESVREIHAGCVFGIGGVDDVILKTATLSSTPHCYSFNNVKTNSDKIVRVAVEPNSTSDMPILEHGLKLLSMADPGCDVIVQPTGEHIIAAAGELHLNRCLGDLKKLYARIDFRVSLPLVSYKETVTNDLAINIGKTMENESEGENGKEDEEGSNNVPSPVDQYAENLSVEASKIFKKTVVRQFTKDNSYCICVSAKPIPSSVIAFVNSHRDEIKSFIKWRKRVHSRSRSSSLGDDATENSDVTVEEENDLKYTTIKDDLLDAFKEGGEDWNTITSEEIWALGPSKCGPNLLRNRIPKFHPTNSFFSSPTGSKIEETSEVSKDPFSYINFVSNSIVTGFELAVGSGPLCEEPMEGVCFEVWEVTRDESIDLVVAQTLCGPVTGQVISTMKEVCKKSFLRRGQRIVEAIFDCHVQLFESSNIGKVYSLLAKRRAKIRDECLKEGSNIYEITANIPAAESFGLADDLYKISSGAAQSQLVFSHWEVLDQDPNFELVTEEQQEESGYNIQSLGNNIARELIDNVRRRKGLAVKEKIVAGAEKQRTLAKKK